MQPPRMLPPWFRCYACGLNREGHDLVTRRTPPEYRHEWQTAQAFDRSLARQRAQEALPIEGNKP